MSSDNDDGLQTDVLAATLQGGLQESQGLLEFLARKFEGPLTHLMTIRRKGGLLSKSRTVEEITFRFDERHFKITRDTRGFFATAISKEVRGVVLKTNPVEVDVWLRELAEELARQAERSATLRAALSRFVLG